MPGNEPENMFINRSPVNNATLYDVLFVISLGIYDRDSFLENIVRKECYNFKPIKTCFDKYGNQLTGEKIRTQALWPAVCL